MPAFGGYEKRKPVDDWQETLPLFQPIWWPYADIPRNAIKAEGQAVKRCRYPALFKVSGTTHGNGDGVSTFNVLDMRGRVPIGMDNMGGGAASRITSSSTGGSNINTIGGAGGAEYLNQSNSQLSAHTHTYLAPAINYSGNAPNAHYGAQTANNTGSTGSGTAMSTTQPWLAGYWIIRVH